MKKSNYKFSKNDLEQMIKFFAWFDSMDINLNVHNIYDVSPWKRFRHCKAEYRTVSSKNTGEILYIVLRSYNTIVCVIDARINVCEIRGRYSMTTYQHIAKFMHDYGCNESTNYELVNWFKK